MGGVSTPLGVLIFYIFAPKCNSISAILDIGVAHSRGKENGTQTDKNAKTTPKENKNAHL